MQYFDSRRYKLELETPQKIKLACKLLGHKWRCYWGSGSYCKRCGIIFGNKMRGKTDG